MILHLTTQMELIKLDKSIVQNRQPDGKITPWQLARIYIYTLPFANLDMILKNANLQMQFSAIKKSRGTLLVEVFQCSFIHLFTVHRGML